MLRCAANVPSIYSSASPALSSFRFFVGDYFCFWRTVMRELSRCMCILYGCLLVGLVQGRNWLWWSLFCCMMWHRVCTGSHLIHLKCRSQHRLLCLFYLWSIHYTSRLHYVLKWRSDVDRVQYAEPGVLFIWICCSPPSLKRAIKITGAVSFSRILVEEVLGINPVGGTMTTTVRHSWFIRRKSFQGFDRLGMNNDEWNINIGSLRYGPHTGDIEEYNNYCRSLSIYHPLLASPIYSKL